MSMDPFNRKLSLLASIFAFIGVLLGAIALGTNYWTIDQSLSPARALPTFNGTMLIQEQINSTWNGLFVNCTSTMEVQCRSEIHWLTFVVCLLGLLFVLMGGIFLTWDLFRLSDRRFVIPMLLFVGVVLLTVGLVNYGSMFVMNFHSSRLMICSLVFAFTALPISSFVAGRHSTLNHFVNNGHVNNGQKFLSTSNGN